MYILYIKVAQQILKLKVSAQAFFSFKKTQRNLVSVKKDWTDLRIVYKISSEKYKYLGNILQTLYIIKRWS